MKLLSLSLAAVASLPLLALTAHAQTAAIINPGSGTPETQFITIGFQFDLSANESLSALGFWDGGNGLNTSHEVGIWDTSSGVQLADATVSATSAGVNDSTGFIYATSVTDLNSFNGTLTAGTNYTIGALTGGGDPYLNDDAPSTIVTASGVTLLGSVFGTPTFGFPENLNNTGAAYIGPNFEFTAPAVPEPSTYVLLGVGLLVMVVLQRRKSFFC